MSIVLVGYASLDYAVRLDRPPQPDRTATILFRPNEWPRLGGSPAYICAALANAGVRDAALVSWVGDDAEGTRYRDGLARLGAPTEGIAIGRGRTPVSILAYEPEGGCHCLYDPGLAEPLELDGWQRSLISTADQLCLTVGPCEATRTALELARPEAAVIWSVKADPRAVPPDLAAALATRADIVVFNRGEAGFVADAFAAAVPPIRLAISVETRGREGVAVVERGVQTIVPANPVEAEDATGAGDTFLGGYIAARMKGADPPTAAKAGVEAARSFLAARKETERRG